MGGRNQWLTLLFWIDVVHDRHALLTQVYVVKCWKTRRLIWWRATCWVASSVIASQRRPSAALRRTSTTMMPTAVHDVASESTLLNRFCHLDASGIVRASAAVSGPPFLLLCLTSSLAVITARSKLHKVLFLALSVTFCFYCLWINYLGNRCSNGFAPNSQ